VNWENTARVGCFGGRDGGRVEAEAEAYG